jgi:hypothetical protein
MHELVYALAIVAAIALIVTRQAMPRRISGDPRGLMVLPAILVVAGFTQGHLVDSAHKDLSVGLFAAELVVGLLMGIGWARTSRIWRAEDGSVWSRGTKGTAVVWVGGLAVRVGLMGLTALLHVSEGSGALLVALGISFGLRSFLLARRAATLSPSSGPTYRDGMTVSSRKDRV